MSTYPVQRSVLTPMNSKNLLSIYYGPDTVPKVPVPVALTVKWGDNLYLNRDNKGAIKQRQVDYLS